MISIRRFAVAATMACCVPASGAAETPILQTHIATLSSSPMELAGELKSIANELLVSQSNGVVMLAYSSDSVPVELASFLTDILPELDQNYSENDFPANFSLALVPKGTGTQMRLMLLQPKKLGGNAVASSLPEGTDVVVNDGFGKDCTGQLVLGYDQPDRAAIGVFSEWLTSEGYDVVDTSDSETIFLIGNKFDCSVFLFIQPDPDAPQRSMVVVRYLED